MSDKPNEKLRKPSAKSSRKRAGGIAAKKLDKKLSLKDIKRHHLFVNLHPDEAVERASSGIIAYRQEIQNSSDRACCLLSLSMIDQSLLSSIAIKSINVEILYDLTEPHRALSSTSAKADICYLIGGIGQDEYHDINILRGIRNIFAHSVLALNLEEPVISEQCQRLRLAGDKSSARTMFVSSADAVVTRMLAMKKGHAEKYADTLEKKIAQLSAVKRHSEEKIEKMLAWQAEAEEVRARYERGEISETEAVAMAGKFHENFESLAQADTPTVDSDATMDFDLVLRQLGFRNR